VPPCLTPGQIARCRAAAGPWSTTWWPRRRACWRTRRRPASPSLRTARAFPRKRRSGRLLETAPGPARFLRRYGGRCIIVTAAAASQAAGCGSVRAITPVIGRTGSPPRSRISPGSVAATTARSTKRGTRSIDSRTASFGSGARTVGSSPTSRRLSRCPTIPWGCCERGTHRRGIGHPSADGDAGVARRAPRRGVGDRRLASAGQVGAMARFIR
jgi:hypothetical protein